MRVTMRNQPGLLRKAAEWHGIQSMRTDSIAFGVVDDSGVLQAVVTIDNQQAYSCDLHIASNGQKRWGTRAVCEFVSRFIFDQLGKTKIKTCVPAWNARALNMCRSLGFVVEGHTKCGAHDGSDGVYMGMTRDECRWLKMEKKDG